MGGLLKRKVMCITAIRSEYYFQRPIFEALQSHAELDLELVVTGAHLSGLYGNTSRLVEEDGFPIVATINSLLNSDTRVARLKGAALQLQTLTHVVEDRRPDWLLASGDREEAMLLGLCGAYMNIPVAHYAAGDLAVGNVDDTVRHAVSRLAHLLFATNDESAQRLVRAGEEAWRVHSVGHTGIDRIRTTPRISETELASQLGVPAIKRPYAVVIQHPLSSEIEASAAHMRATMDAIAEVGIEAFVSYPNSDAGSHSLIDVLEAYRQRPRVHLFRNIPDTPFVNLLRGADMLIGNSSMGVLEAPYLHLPALNVGRRQTGRLHASNLTFVDPTASAIAAHIRELLDGEGRLRRQARECVNPYGDGHASERVVQILASTPLDMTLMNKRFVLPVGQEVPA